MKFTILDVKANHEQESDYETAVDMSHSTIEELDVRLKAETGAIISLSQTVISTSYSYLEPDFDEFEESGETVYVSHTSDEAPSYSETRRGFAEGVSVLPDLSEQDWAFYDQSEDSAGWHDDRVEMPNDVRSRLIAFEGFKANQSYPMQDLEGGYYNPGPGQELKDAWVKALLKGLPSNVSRGQSFELSISPELEQVLIQSGQARQDQEQKNQRTEFKNKINRQAFLAKKEITQTVEVARQQLKIR